MNNAGSAETGPFAKADPQVFQDMWNVHLMGAVHASQAVLPGMVERGFGRIVNVASTAGLRGYPYVSAYCAAKHALVGLTRALAAETATRGVTVNAVCPGYTDTDMVRDSIDRVVEQDRPRPQRRARRIPPGHADRPPDPARGGRRRGALSVLAAGGGGHRHDARGRGRRDVGVMEDQTIPLDAETKVAERPHDHKNELRLWLRLLTCTDADRERGAPAAARQLRRHAAALRPAGAARPRARTA